MPAKYLKAATPTVVASTPKRVSLLVKNIIEDKDRSELGLPALGTDLERTVESLSRVNVNVTPELHGN